MKVVIVEDEKLAADHLERMLYKAFPSVDILARLSSVKDAIIYFLKRPELDYVFMDIQLADGLSFEILDSIQIDCPIIFTTAYDEYAVKAFKVNSIAYLLKPIDQEDLEGAINKAATLGIESAHIRSVAESITPGFKERFLIKIGEHIRSIPSEDIIRFYSKDKINFLVTDDFRHLPIDLTMDELEKKLNPKLFFRVSRGNIINLNSMKDIISFTNSRLKIIPLDEGARGEDLIVARERVQAFKEWLDR